MNSNLRVGLSFGSYFNANVVQKVTKKGEAIYSDVTVHANVDPKNNTLLGDVFSSLAGGVNKKATLGPEKAKQIATIISNSTDGNIIASVKEMEIINKVRNVGNDIRQEVILAPKKPKVGDVKVTYSSAD